MRPFRIAMILDQIKLSSREKILQKILIAHTVNLWNWVNGSLSYAEDEIFKYGNVLHRIPSNMGN